MMHAIVKQNDLAPFFAKLDATKLDRALTGSPGPKTVVLVFDQDVPPVGTLPRRIIVPDDELDTFFAWAATYLDVLSPITSFLEVIPTSESFVMATPIVSERRRSAVLAVAAVEGAVQLLRSRAKNGPGLLAAALRCVSWVYAQTVMSALPAAQVGSAVERWIRLRSALTGLDLPYPLEHINAFWTAVLPALDVRLAKDDSRLSRINVEMLDHGTAGFERWAVLSPLLETAASLEPVMRGPRQQRVEILDNAARHLPADTDDHELLAAFCGYIGSRVADGGLEVWNAVLERSARFPTMPLWFAFYCGVHATSSVLDFERSLPRRLLRVTDDASYDVDARELLVLARGRSPLVSETRLPTPGTIRARLGPGVIAAFLARDPAANVGGEARKRDKVPQDSPSSPLPDMRQARGMVNEARTAAERAVSTLTRLEQFFSQQEARPTRQPDLGLDGPPGNAPRKGTRKRGKN